MSQNYIGTLSLRIQPSACWTWSKAPRRRVARKRTHIDEAPQTFDRTGFCLALRQHQNGQVLSPPRMLCGWIRWRLVDVSLYPGNAEMQCLAGHVHLGFGRRACPWNIMILLFCKGEVDVLRQISWLSHSMPHMERLKSADYPTIGDAEA